MHSRAVRTLNSSAAHSKCSWVAFTFFHKMWQLPLCTRHAARAPSPLPPPHTPIPLTGSLVSSLALVVTFVTRIMRCRLMRVLPRPF